MSGYVHPTEQLVTEIVVRDMRLSADFYRALGFELLRDEVIAQLEHGGDSEHERRKGEDAAFGDLLPSDDTLSVTAWMSGVFGSQLTIGNTSFNTLISVAAIRSTC